MKSLKPTLFILFMIFFSCSKDDNTTSEETLFPEPSGELIISYFNNLLTLDLGTKAIQLNNTKSFNYVAESPESFFKVDRANNTIIAYSKTNREQQWSFSPEHEDNEEIRFANSKVHFDGQTGSVFIHYRIVNMETFGSTYKTVKLSATTGLPQVTLTPVRETHHHTTLGNNYFFLDRLGTDNSTWMLNKRNSILLSEQGSITLNRFPQYLTTHNQSLIIVYANGDIVGYNEALEEIWDVNTGGTNNTSVNRSNDRLYVSSRNNKLTGIDLLTGNSRFSIDTEHDRSVPLDADASGIYFMDANSEGISVKKHNQSGTSMWSTKLEVNLTEDDSFNMKGIALPNHLLIAIAWENSDETYDTQVHLIQKNNGTEIWKESSVSMSANINNLFVVSENAYYYTN